jgi:hypothetical protein
VAVGGVLTGWCRRVKRLSPDLHESDRGADRYPSRTASHRRRRDRFGYGEARGRGLGRTPGAALCGGGAARAGVPRAGGAC